MDKFRVTFKGKEYPNWRTQSLVIIAPNEKRAEAWGEKQLEKWGLDNLDIQVEVGEPDEQE
jgi:hypothetical protein